MTQHKEKRRRELVKLEKRALRKDQRQSLKKQLLAPNNTNNISDSEFHITGISVAQRLTEQTIRHTKADGYTHSDRTKSKANKTRSLQRKADKLNKTSLLFN